MKEASQSRSPGYFPVLCVRGTIQDVSTACHNQLYTLVGCSVYTSISGRVKFSLSKLPPFHPETTALGNR